MDKYLTVCLVNEIYDLKETDFVDINENISLRKASEVDLDLLKGHIELFQESFYNLWTNYFENEITLSNDKLNPKTNKLEKEKHRYTILQYDKFPLSDQELISLKLSDLNLNILIQKGFELTDNKEMELKEDGETIFKRDFLTSYNSLIDTQNKFNLYGSKKYLRKKPTKSVLVNYNKTLEQVTSIYNSEGDFGIIIKALEDYIELDRISNESPFKLVNYFSLIESLITHNPKSEYGNSISKQLSNKIEFLYNNFLKDFDFKDYFKGPDSNTINTIINLLYNYRSDIAHGNIPKFHKELKIVQQNIDNVLPFMEALLRQILKYSISKPSLILDLKRC